MNNRKTKIFAQFGWKIAFLMIKLPNVFTDRKKSFINKILKKTADQIQKKD